jgi:hypothetical protein
MRLIPASAAAASKLVKFRVMPSAETENDEVSEPVTDRRIAAAALLNVLCPDV